MFGKSKKANKTSSGASQSEKGERVECGNSKSNSTKNCSGSATQKTTKSCSSGNGCHSGKSTSK